MDRGWWCWSFSGGVRAPIVGTWGLSGAHPDACSRPYQGSEDPVLPPEVVRELAAAVPDAEVHEFGGCGHSVYWENAADFNRVLDRFLAQHI